MIRVTRSTVIDAPIERVWEVLRDFNSHDAWHPVVARSEIENGEGSDQVGCVRNFTLHDGNRIREQLLALSDEDHISTYCILDATLPMERYVATVQLKRVTDGERTFWHWQSTFDVPRGREREFAELVGKGVYEAGFDGLRTYLRRGPALASVRSAPLSAEAQPAHGIVATALGGPEVLQYRSLTALAPGPGEIRVRHTVIGVNYIDVYVRSGAYRMIDPPAPIGMEAAGIVADVGPGVAHLLPGDRVAYAAPVPGAYATLRTMPAAPLVLLPDDIADETAAAIMLKGMTAEYLLHRTHRVARGDVVLVHAAAGGVGLFLCQWAEALGARVIGTISTEEKARRARENGCAVPIVTRDGRFAEAVKAATHGRGADVIFDGLGRAAMEENLDALALCGHWVSYGQASGPLDVVPTAQLSAKSATLSRPVLFHYTAERAALEEMTKRTFDALRQGILRVDVRHRYPLAAAAEAHRDLEARRTTGQLVLLP
jgi:NADPH:quinone reductase